MLARTLRALRRDGHERGVSWRRVGDPVLDQLDSAQRLSLLKFVCSFAWADLAVVPAERAFVARLVDRLGLSEDEAQRVNGWLDSPPPEDELDPYQISMEHREIFIETVRGVIRVDGEVAPEEQENLDLLSELLRWEQPDEESGT